MQIRLMKNISIIISIIIIAVGLTIIQYFNLPGVTYEGPAAELTNKEKAIKSSLEKHIKVLSVDIGQRNQFVAESLDKSANYIESQFLQCSEKVRRQVIHGKVHKADNIIATLGSVKPQQGRIIIGAHYDSVHGSPGANDNASGVATILMLCEMLKGQTFKHAIEFVAFANEEPPNFKTKNMGSYVYAKSLREQGVEVKAMLSIETVGAYYNEENSQKYPEPIEMFYPDRGDFIAFVSNHASAPIVKSVIRAFRETTEFPSEGLIAPVELQGVDFSDHWSFWQFDYPAIMVTDTAFFRYNHYHTDQDSYDKVNFNSLARVVNGLEKVVSHLGRNE